MADAGAPSHPNILVSDEGAPPGCVYMTDEATGRTVVADRDTYTSWIRDLRTG